MEYRDEEEASIDVTNRPELPTEVWELIFRNLSARWLRSARLTCRSWDQIIRGSSRLMDKLVLTLSRKNFIGVGERRPLRTYLATRGSYTRAKFAFFQVSGVNPFWNFLAPLGVTLHTLCLEFSATEGLLGNLLRELRNLKRFDIKAKTNVTFRDVEPGFRLEKLEELTIRYNPSPNLVNFCRQISPQLTVLKLGNSITGPKHDRVLITFLNSTTCQTLQELKVTVSEIVLGGLVGFEDIRLKRLAVGTSSTEQDILRMVNLQPNLEELEVTTAISIPIFHEIISGLTKLKHLSVKIAPQHFQQTLSLMNLANVENLTIKYEYRIGPRLNLTDCNFFNVRILSLYGCNVSSPILSPILSVLQQTRTIVSLTLKGCRMDRFADLTLLKSLKHLVLGKSDLIRDLNLPAEGDHQLSPTFIRSVKLIDVRDEQAIKTVATIFPNLERFESVESHVDDGVFQVLALRSPLLKALRLCGGCNFEGHLSRWVKLFGALEVLTVECPWPGRIREELRDIVDHVEVVIREKFWGEYDD